MFRSGQTTLSQLREESGSWLKLTQRWQATRKEMVTSGRGLAADGLCLHLEARSISASIVNGETITINNAKKSQCLNTIVSHT